MSLFSSESLLLPPTTSSSLLFLCSLPPRIKRIPQYSIFTSALAQRHLFNFFLYLTRTIVPHLTRGRYLLSPHSSLFPDDSRIKLVLLGKSQRILYSSLHMCHDEITSPGIRSVLGVCFNLNTFYHTVVFFFTSCVS